MFTIYMTVHLFKFEIFMNIQEISAIFLLINKINWLFFKAYKNKCMIKPRSGD